MLRSLLTLLLAATVLSGASAQTIPAKATAKAAKAVARAERRTTKKTKRLVRKEARATAAQTRRDAQGWPVLAEAAPVAAADATPATPAEPAFVDRPESIVYAAPGMGVRLQTNKKMLPYSVVPPRKKPAETTMGQ